ncbi:hypothetical protein [Spiroplasma endosymbiont of Cantharis nigra]|uniref:hypothetical protein n=1 Tax=Spiroplasma endosymbiont of Cantharis nigra TaxID=3066278 RepID=UPI0030D33DD1
MNKKYNINNETFINRECVTNLFMSKDSELKLLKEELKKTKRKWAIKIKSYKGKVKYQLFEICMSSLLAHTWHRIRLWL